MANAKTNDGQTAASSGPLVKPEIPTMANYFGDDQEGFASRCFREVKHLG